MPGRSFEKLPDEILINIFRHLAPNVGDSSNQTTSLFQDTDHELWHPLTGEGCVNDDGGSSASGRQALLNACVLSKRIAPYAQRALYQSVTPWLIDFIYNTECGSRGYFPSLQQSFISETYNNRFRHTQTLVCRAEDARSLNAVLDATQCLERLQLYMDPVHWKQSITIIKCVSKMSTLRSLDLVLDYTASPYREEVATAALGMTRLTELSISSPGRVQSQASKPSGPHLRSLCLKNVNDIAIPRISERVDVSQLVRLSISFDSDSESVTVFSIDNRFASLKTLTLDNLTTMDISPLINLSGLDTLALGFNRSATTDDLQEIFDVSRAGLLGSVCFRWAGGP